MKRKLSFLFVLTIVVGMGWMSGCSKQDAAMDARNEVTVMKSEEVNDTGPEKQILSFMNECKLQRNSQHGIPGKFLRLAEATWLLEASFNFAFSHPMAAATVRTYDTVLVGIPFAGDSVSMMSATICANKLLDSLSSFYASSPGTDKTILTITVEAMPALQNGMLPLTVVFESGCKINPNNQTTLFYYDDSNYWFWGFGQGKCAAYSGSYFGCDAATVFVSNQAFFQMDILVPPGMKLYYTDFVVRSAAPIDFPNPLNAVPADNKYDYLMYLSNPAWPNHHDCLSPPEMNFYFNKLSWIVWHGLMPPGASQTNCHFVSLNIDSQFAEMPCPPDMINSNIHKVYVKYGKPHFTTNYDYPLPAPLYQWN